MPEGRPRSAAESPDAQAQEVRLLAVWDVICGYRQKDLKRNAFFLKKL